MSEETVSVKLPRLWQCTYLQTGHPDRELLTVTNGTTKFIMRPIVRLPKFFTSSMRVITQGPGDRVWVALDASKAFGFQAISIPMKRFWEAFMSVGMSGQTLNSATWEIAKSGEYRWARISNEGINL